jgi:6-pyruvoyl-tetrahydropterin synthase
MKVISRRFRLSAIHQLLPESEDPKCCAVHGHEYLIAVTLQAPECPIETARQLQSLDRIFQVRVTDSFSGSGLHLKFPSSSGEYLAWAFRQQIMEAMPQAKIRLSIQETRKNYFSATLP